mmetsp:Transcript_38521/g.46546  ORF Transcript_38521/g.46546 Transcript_38521/m.46546 type:complete len:422 (+) Transcript_38521:123-1388(+)|eukprot:CAMPEP_0197860868 /NCGR_PEP_ID=MMETSP1438-20131217/36530_1 /TAXON_ID=1461541 /ORGANISM="Pterosperma sp., Strain CCMP1384" /LENGTH=421 /DNA_ID=CAMNT_0043477869 /DNA_START=103 /DNA_END=1368 /DNA_ORIENTATION=+
MLRLNCPAQNYDWGKKGDTSLVAKLHNLGSGNPVDEAKPYAELWCGTHPSGPSTLADGGDMKLKDWIVSNPEAIGKVVHDRWGAELPYLFKVLSVATALSIQAHPHKALAEQLHAERPNVYKDDNHKPEMAVALSEFEALSAFVTLAELVEALNTVPELKAAVGEEASAAVIAAHSSGADAKGPFKEAFTKLMTCSPDVVSNSISTLVARLKSSATDLTAKEKLIIRLDEQYPADVGVLSAYFLNYIVLAPGEAVYMAANEPHAYLAGECAEVMATSDNVVRAGLTPKLRDTAILCDMLTYKLGKPEILTGTPTAPHTQHYSPPFDEFEMDIVTAPAGVSCTVPAGPGPSLLLMVEGSSTSTAKAPEGTAWSETQGVSNNKPVSFKAGDVFFLPAGASVDVQAAEAGAKIIRSSCASKIFA